MNKFGLLMLVCVAWSALAQEANGLDGRWAGSVVTPAGGTMSIELVVNGETGTWQNFPHGIQAREFPCLTPKHAITVRQRTATELIFSIDASASLRGCQDGRAFVRLIDDKHLEGQMGDGRALKLSRK